MTWAMRSFSPREISNVINLDCEIFSSDVTSRRCRLLSLENVIDEKAGDLNKSVSVTDTCISGVCIYLS